MASADMIEVFMVVINAFCDGVLTARRRMMDLEQRV